MQCRVDGSLREIEGLAALASDFFDHGVAVRRACRQRSEHDQVQVALEPFAFHTLRHYALAGYGSSRRGRPCRRGRRPKSGGLDRARRNPADIAGSHRRSGSLFVDAIAYLLRGTKTWPLTPQPPSVVSKICTKSLFAGSGDRLAALSTTSVMPFIIALFCSSVSTPAGTWTSTSGAPKVPVETVSARTLGAPANVLAATVAVIKTFRRLNPSVLSGNFGFLFGLLLISITQP